MYDSYIRAIIYRTVLRNNEVVDTDDLYQCGIMALLTASKKSPNNTKAYLQSAIRNEIYREANRFYGCFTIGNNVIPRVQKCRRHPEEYDNGDPIKVLTFHEVEGYYG